MSERLAGVGAPAGTAKRSAQVNERERLLPLRRTGFEGGESVQEELLALGELLEILQAPR